MTPRGLVDLYVLVFMHLETREVFVTPSTRSPDSAWVTNQAKSFVNHVSAFADGEFGGHRIFCVMMAAVLKLGTQKSFSKSPPASLRSVKRELAPLPDGIFVILTLRSRL